MSSNTTRDLDRPAPSDHEATQGNSTADVYCQRPPRTRGPPPSRRQAASSRQPAIPPIDPSRLAPTPAQGRGHSRGRLDFHLDPSRLRPAPARGRSLIYVSQGAGDGVNKPQKADGAIQTNDALREQLPQVQVRVDPDDMRAGAGTAVWTHEWLHGHVRPHPT